MKLIPLCQTMAFLGVWTLPASAADLSKIDRHITQEPAYQTNTPKYCLMVFGAEAKHRVWLVLDGDTLYVDKKGSGDLANDSERFKAPAFTATKHPANERERSIAVGDITIGGFTHTGLTVNQTQYRRKVDVSNGAGGSSADEWQEYLDSIWRQIPDGVVYNVSINLDPKCYGLFQDTDGQHILHNAWIDRTGHLAFADRPKDAPIIHFGGPLTMRRGPGEKLQRGNDETAETNPPWLQKGKTTLCLGTPGLGPGAFVTAGCDLVPKDVHPTVEVQFPAREPGQQSVTRKYVLKERC
jgi:hypothetical protein